MNVDPRGQRFNAALSAIVLVIVLITSSAWLLGFQAVVFGIGAVFGLRYAPYGLIYRFAVRPRLGPPAELEAEAPPRFSQGVGLVISIIGVIGYAVGIVPLGMAAAAAALAAGATDSVQRIHRLLGPSEPLGRVRRQLLRASAAALAVTPLLLALTPAVLALALGKLPAA